MTRLREEPTAAGPACEAGQVILGPTATDVATAKRDTNGIYCEDLDRLAHEVIAMSVACMKGDRAARQRVFQVLLCAYVGMFVVGMAAFAVALYQGLMTDGDTATTGIFAGLSVTSFVALFILRPLKRIRENSISLSWLNIATTSYWTRHYYLNKRGLLNAEIETITADTLAHLHALLHDERPAESEAADDTDVPPLRAAEPPPAAA